MKKYKMNCAEKTYYGIKWRYRGMKTLDEIKEYAEYSRKHNQHFCAGVRATDTETGKVVFETMF